MTTAAPNRVRVRYEVAASRADWTLSEEPMPESQPHDLTLDLLKALLVAWAARTKISAQVARNIAVRWDEARPSMGVDPDLAVITPRTPEGDELESLCTWLDGHAPPLLAVEVVSRSNARKDYESAPEKHAASGAQELWVFDPKLAGPRSKGGPFLLQVWRRDEDASFTRVYAGAGPAFSPVVNGWLVVVHEGQRLRIADDANGTRFWETREEAERAAKEAERTAKEAERTAKEAERAAKEAALARIAELEAELARKR